MKRRDFMKSLTAGSLALFAGTRACHAMARAAARRPNFLFIYTDDQRWDAMGAVQREQGARARFPWFKTPHMDRLAAGQKPAQWRQSFLVEYYRELGGCPTAVGVRTATAKLVKYPGHPEWTEAYDLAADPYELKNLAADPVTMAKLGAELDAQMKAANYSVPLRAATPQPPAATTRRENDTQTNTRQIL